MMFPASSGISTSTKSPISVLQELAAAKIISSPEYTLTEENRSFKYEVKVGSLIANAISNNKKVAKHLCAFEILKVLELQTDNNTKCEDHPNNVEDYVNAVGKLNELCAQKKAGPPVYADRGWCDGKFVVECKCLSYTTEGKSMVKKLAKCLAASEMLTKNEFTKLITSVEAKIAETFKETDFPKVKDGKSESKIKYEVPTTKKVDLHVLQSTLEFQLRKLGYVYNVHMLQADPLILSLKVSNQTNDEEKTFVKCCDNFQECYIELLKQVIKIVEV